jgi:NodT family efflux transporter outer membrane factor (OMF) lipoprotein
VNIPKLYRLLAAAILAAVSGCAVGPDFHRPDGDLQQVVLQAKDAAPTATGVTADPVPQAWWTLFKDPVLDSLVAQAWDSNLDLQAATARLRQSRAQEGIAGAGLLPQVGSHATYQKQAVSPYGPWGLVGAPAAPHDSFDIGFDASWEIDLWNHQGRIQEGALAQVEASAYDREVVRVSLAAEIARTYLTLRGTQERLDIARQNQDIAQHMVRLAQSRQRNGVATRFDLASALAQSAEVDALVPALRQQQNELMNALALASGEPPRHLDDVLSPTGRIPEALPQIAVGIPSELARRRPDILKAEARLHAATADIGAAEADFYPRISLIGSLGLLSFKEADLGKWSARQFSVGPSVYLPIFEGGRLKQTLELTKAREQAAAIDYRKTVLQAWHEIDNALNARLSTQQRHDALAVAYKQSSEALDAARQSYLNGATDYVSVLVAQHNVLSSQLELSESSTAAAVSMVTLYKALGGGWDPKVLAATTARDPSATAPAGPAS